jgi:hypothetical protein
MRLVVAALLAMLPIASITSGTIEPDTPDSRHIEYGNRFPCVAKLTCREVKGKKLCVASCVVISPGWVVTAAHAVHETENWIVEVEGGDVRRLSKIIVNKDFKGQIGDFDIALGVVEGKINLDEYPALYVDRNEAGKVVSIVGHGWTGTMDKGSTEYDGLRRGGRNVVEYTRGDFLICRASDVEHHIDLEFMIAPGDSGGGLFIGKSLAGINLYRQDPRNKDGLAKSVFGDESGHLRVSIYEPWIRQEIAKHEGK